MTSSIGCNRSLNFALKKKQNKKMYKIFSTFLFVAEKKYNGISLVSNDSWNQLRDRETNKLSPKCWPLALVRFRNILFREMKEGSWHEESFYLVNFSFFFYNLVFIKIKNKCKLWQAYFDYTEEYIHLSQVQI